MRLLSFLLALLGLGLIGLLLAHADLGAVVSAVRSVGAGGFLVLFAWQGVMFLILGLAWLVVMPQVGLARVLWGRMVRDAVTTCLPFSPVGGYVAGARALTLRAVPWPAAAAGTAVDVTGEIVAQLLFTLAGLAGFALLRPGLPLLWPLLAVVAVALGLLLALLWRARQAGRLLVRLGERLLGAWFAQSDGLGRLQASLTRLARPRRVGIGTLVHLVGWVATGIWTWITLRLLGAETGLLEVIALEALLDALIAAAFIVPAAAGVQELGYIGLGAAFGVPADLALGVSLLRRGKDLAWGLPVLGVWQWVELRRLRMAGLAGRSRLQPLVREGHVAQGKLSPRSVLEGDTPEETSDEHRHP